MTVSITIDEKSLKELKTDLRQRLENMRNMKSPLSAIAIHLFRSVIKNFENQGTDKKKWKRLSRFTKFVKSHREQAPSKRSLILQDSGRLKNSIIPVTGENFAQVGTNVKYARLMNYGGRSEGGSVKIKSFKRTSKLGNEYRVKGFTMNIKAGHKVPARPFLIIRKEQNEKIKAIARNWFFKGSTSEQ